MQTTSQYKSIERLRMTEQRKSHLESLAKSGLLTRSQAVELAKLKGSRR